MSSLIFFIFMIWFIMRIVKNKQKATGQNDPKQTQGSNTPGSVSYTHLTLPTILLV